MLFPQHTRHGPAPGPLLMLPQVPACFHSSSTPFKYHNLVLTTNLKMTDLLQLLPCPLSPQHLSRCNHTTFQPPHSTCPLLWSIPSSPPCLEGCQAHSGCSTYACQVNSVDLVGPPPFQGEPTQGPCRPLWASRWCLHTVWLPPLWDPSTWPARDSLGRSEYGG